MFNYMTLARPYAKAAFEYALENSLLYEWKAFLSNVDLLMTQPLANKFFQHPKVTFKEKLDFLENLLKPNEKQKNWLRLLVSYHRLKVAPEIKKLFESLTKQHEGIVDVTVSAAYKMDDTQKSSLQKALEIRLGKKVVLSWLEDKRLIGGAVIQAGDSMMDGSIRGKLKTLRKVLMS